jgi:hypothetical protein
LTGAGIASVSNLYYTGESGITPALAAQWLAYPNPFTAARLGKLALYSVYAKSKDFVCLDYAF